MELLKKIDNKLELIYNQKKLGNLNLIDVKQKAYNNPYIALKILLEMYP